MEEGTVWFINRKRLDSKNFSQEKSFTNMSQVHEQAHAIFGHMRIIAPKKVYDHLKYKLNDDKIQFL